MASSSRRKLTLNNVSVKLGCGSCRRRKPMLLLHFLFHRKPNSNHNNSSSSSSSFYHYNYETSTTTTTTTTTFSPFYDDNNNMMTTTQNKKKKKKQKQPYSPSTTVKGFGRVGSEGSVAVEKDSEDPFLDFKHSMIQMILENEIYTKEDLRELLNCFLQLNSPHHHAVILRAFTQICNGVFSNSHHHHHFNRKSREF